MITWTASNNSSFLNGRREAKTIRAAVRDARRYVDSELYGDGVITYYREPEMPFNFDNDEDPFRVDAKNIYTGYRWSTNEDFS